MEETPADGDCFFHAVINSSTDVLRGYSSISLRAELCDFLGTHRDTVIFQDEHGSATLKSLFSVSDSTAKSYNARVRQLRRPFREYADILIIYALVNRFNVALDILDLQTGSWYLHAPLQQHQTLEIINLVREYTPACHYMGTAPASQ